MSVRVFLFVLCCLVASLARAEDILASGTYYYDATITWMSPDWVTIQHRGGSVTLAWKDLSTGAQREYASQHDKVVADEKALHSMTDSGAVRVNGVVLSIFPAGGVLVKPDQSDKVFVLRGLPNEKSLVDGDRISSTWVYVDGSFTYHTAGGAAATVRAYRTNESGKSSLPTKTSTTNAIATITGTGDKTGDPFTITKDGGFTVDYQTVRGYLGVNIYQMLSKRLVANASLKNGGQDHTFVPLGAGTYYISVTALNDFSVNVTQ